MFWNLMVIAILHAVNTGDTAESLKISRETTRFTAPLVQGRLDYFAAIDDLHSKPPRENAFAALLQVFPDDLINQVEREAYASRLGIDFSDSHLHRLQPVPEECLDDLREAARNPWKPIENRDFAHWINDNREALADASATAKLPEFFIPLVIHPVGPIAPAAHVNLVDANPFKAMVLLGEALCANAGQAIRDGGSSVAVSDIESAFRLAHHLARSPFFVGRMCARRIEHTACLAIASLLNRGDMTHENSLDLFNRFKKLKPIAFFGAPNLVIDRIGTIQFLDYMSHKEMENIRDADVLHLAVSVAEMISLAPSRGITIDFNKMAKHVNDVFDRTDALLMKPAGLEKYNACVRFEADLMTQSKERRKAKKVTAETLLDILLLPMVPDVSYFCVLESASIAEVRLVKIGLASQLFRFSRQRLPNSLAEISVVISNEEMTNPATGTPFEFTRTTQVVEIGGPTTFDLSVEAKNNYFDNQFTVRISN